MLAACQKRDRERKKKKKGGGDSLISFLRESLFKVAAFALAEPEVVVAVFEADPRAFFRLILLTRHEAELGCFQVLHSLLLVGLLVIIVVLLALVLFLVLVALVVVLALGFAFGLVARFVILRFVIFRLVVLRLVDGSILLLMLVLVVFTMLFLTLALALAVVLTLEMLLKRDLGVTLDRQKIILQRHLPEVVPVATVVQIRSLSLLVNDERRINCIGQIVRRTIIFVPRNDQRTVILPGSLLHIVSRRNTDSTLLGSGLAERVEAVELALPLDGRGGPGTGCIIAVWNDAVLLQDGSDLLPGSAQVGCFEDGDVYAALEEVEGIVDFEDVGVVGGKVAFIGERVFVALIED